MAGNDLNVKVDATTTGFEAGIARAQRATLQYDSALQRLQSDMAALEKSMDDDVTAALDRQHQAMTKTGQGMFIFGAAVAAGLGMAVNEAMKWESAWTGVTKTVDGSAAEMERLEGGLRQLAKSLPATHEEIAAVAEAAGQLGIKRESIIGFTKTMIDLSETTNLTADQAATDMARFANIMQTPQGDIDRLGASLVALGNAGASTEADILSMGMRIAGAGATIGLTEGEVMGLANALSSVGIEAEAGGSAISSVMKTIELKSTQGAEAVSGFAEVAGMSSQAFLDLWTEDAAAGLNAFVTGLGQVESQGGSTVATLQALGFTQIRQSDALLRLANSGDLLTESLQLGNQAWEDNSALLAEAEKRYATTEARVQIAQNTMRDAAIDAGAVILPALAKVADMVADLGAAWDVLPGPVKTAGVVLGIAAAAIGLFGGAALIAIPKIAAFNTAVAGLEAGALKSAGTRVSALGSALMGPLGVGLAAATIGFTLLAAEQGKARRETDALIGTLDEATGAITDLTYQTTLQQLSDEGWLEFAQTVGVSMDDIVDALMNGGSAMDDLKAKVDANKDSIWNPFGNQGLSNDASQFVDNVEAARERIDDAASAGKKLAAGNKAVAEATGEAGDAQKGTTGAWEDGADSAGELSNEIKTLKDLFDDLSGAYLNQRQAGRQVRDSLREIRKAVNEYKEKHDDLDGAFKKGTKSGDEFAGMLDGLATDYQNQIQTTLELSNSEKRTMDVYRDSRARLIEVADQLGYTKKEAREYAQQVLGTPEQIRTFFDAQTETAEADLRRFRGLLDGLNGHTVETFIKTTTLRNDIGESGNPKSGHEANGGIRQAFAGGGFTFGGQYVERVPQIRAGGGSVIWNEPETGWEGYISGKPGMEARNREVWLESGRRLGMLDNRYASIGARSFAAGGHGGSTRVVERTIETLPRSLRLSIGGRDFEAYVDQRADDRVAAGARHDRATGRTR